MSGKKLEILAPAGSPECLTAAVRCGAAAVYLGVGNFNARRSAENFTPESLPEVVAYCHARDVSVHLALNTLIWDREMDDALRLTKIACDAGVDALIVQDVGLARRLRKAAPTMPLHASTQLSCHTPSGVSLLRDAGFSRVVLAREMTREEIAACTDLGVETEIFVHGALCMSVSGQCYFSAMLGGRSGNRGACAQTCRLPFEPTGTNPRPCPADKAALSLKDNCLVSYVSELRELGVTSLKIEGRMKRPEYVAAATALYRAAADGETVSDRQIEQLRSVFSRSGFTDGYYTDRRSGEMFGTRRKEDVLASAEAVRELAHTYDAEKPLIGVDMTLTVRTEGCRLTVQDDRGNRETVNAPGAEVAKNRSLDPARAEEQLCKTGGTPFFPRRVTADVPDGLTVPLSAINAVRRTGLERLLAVRERTPTVPFDAAAIPENLPASPPRPIETFVRLAGMEQWSPAIRADLVFVPLTTPPDEIRRLTETHRVGVEIPRGLFGTEPETRERLHKAVSAGAVAALCGNVGALPLAREVGLTPVGTFSLNIANRDALQWYASYGLQAATVSPELTFSQIRDLAPAPLPVGAFVYGRLPLMLTRNCPRRSATGSCRDCQHQGITDRLGTVFPVMCSGGCSEILNAVPIYWGDHLSDIPPLDFQLFHFTTESPEDVLSVLQAYQTGAPASGPVTRGLYRRGVE